MVEKLGKVRLIRSVVDLKDFEGDNNISYDRPSYYQL